MALTYLKEITKNWETEFRMPCHIYCLDEKSRLVAYIKEGTNEIIPFKKKMRFDQARRKFAVIEEDTIKRLLLSEGDLC